MIQYCGISTDCSAVVTRDGFEQMGGARSPCPGYSKMRQRTETTDLRPIRPISEAREPNGKSHF